MDTKTLNYIPGLDGIRALAAFLVISTHWPNNMLSLKFGWIGVNMFFVLSGFLITRILVSQKPNTFKKFITDFYYKRALRIFPLYYAYLIIGFLTVIILTRCLPQLLTDGDWRSVYGSVMHDFPYYFTYTYNLKINLRYFIHFADSSNRAFGHLWSLSLEEQFYLIFPFLVYFTSVKTLKITTIAVLIICPLLRLSGVLFAAPVVTDTYWLGELFYSNTFCQADALFTGAALALFSFKQAKPYLTFFITAAVWLFVGMTFFFLLRKSGYFLVPFKSFGYDFPGFWFGETTPYWFVNIRPFYGYTLINLLAAALILPAINGTPLFPGIFQAKPIAYLGKISYGIYVFHAPVLTVFIVVANYKFGGWYKLTSNALTEICFFLFYVAIVVGIAHLSYRYFETRILKYKNRLITATVHE
ncbi:MAG: acyltransferase [Mucilaginibacter sp.]|nr:acyltransferase [Mucilaginibacter sp.]